MLCVFFQEKIQQRQWHDRPAAKISFGLVYKCKPKEDGHDMPQHKPTGMNVLHTPLEQYKAYSGI